MLKNKPLLSIIVPFYNVKPYIDCFFESLMDQWTEEIEVICVEDKSTDGTDIVLQEYVDKLLKEKKSIRLVQQQQNKGLSAARNAGLKEAKGEYIWFLDSDDAIQNGAIQFLFDTIRKTPVEIIFFNYDVLFSDKGCPGKDHTALHIEPSKRKKVLTGIEKESQEDRLIHYIENDQFFAWMFIAKHSLYKRIDFQFPSGKFFEDISSMPLLIWHAQSIVWKEKPIVYYRQRPSSIIGNVTVSNRLDLAEAFDPVVPFFLKQNASKTLYHTIELYRFDLIKTAFWDLYVKRLYTNALHMEMYRRLEEWKYETHLTIWDIFRLSFEKNSWKQALMRGLFYMFPRGYFWIQMSRVFVVRGLCRFYNMERCKYYMDRFKAKEEM